MFLLTRDREDFQVPFCSNHGTYRAVNPICHTDLDEEDMFMPYIDFLAPVNYLCEKCLEKSNVRPKLFMWKSSLKDIRGDIGVNDIIVFEKHLRGEVIGRIIESVEVQVV